ncbi:MAG: hypothetical protein U5K69_02790 [Balneolaceae bacterium]|nr:hypothetical protein [Balneolaceae bacterium]
MNVSPGLNIGTSGWSYNNWVGDFYPNGTRKSDMLYYYVEQFDSAEINAIFTACRMKTW